METCSSESDMSIQMSRRRTEMCMIFQAPRQQQAKQLAPWHILPCNVHFWRYVPRSVASPLPLMRLLTIEHLSFCVHNRPTPPPPWQAGAPAHATHSDYGRDCASVSHDRARHNGLAAEPASCVSVGSPLAPWPPELHFNPGFATAPVQPATNLLACLAMCSEIEVTCSEIHR